jgi:hypothetical protein
MRRPLIISFLIVITLASSIALTQGIIVDPRAAMYDEIDTEWREDINENTPQFTMTILNKGKYNFTIIKVVLNEMIVWEGRFIVKANIESKFIINDISTVLALNKGNILNQVYIENSERQPGLYHNIAGYNPTLVYGSISVVHPIESKLPAWLAAGKKASYYRSITSNTSKVTHDFYSFEITSINQAIKEMTIKTNMNDRIVFTEEDPNNPKSQLFLTPSQIEALKATGLYLSQGYQGGTPVDDQFVSDIGTFQTYKIPIQISLVNSQPAEGFLWVEKTTGLVMKYTIDIPANWSSISHIEAEITESNILRGAAVSVKTLQISKTIVNQGEEVEVTVTLENTGELSGSFTLKVSLDGVEKDSSTVTVDSGKTVTKTVKFSSNVEGLHKVTADGKSIEFEVKNESSGVDGFSFEAVFIGLMLAVLLLVVFKNGFR